jgi:hypothetical protein
MGHLNDRTSSLTYWLVGAAGEQITINASEALRAASVCSARASPAVKS